MAPVLRLIWAAIQDPEHHQGFWLMVSGGSALATALILLTAALVAVFQLREARVLRQAQVRPFVVIDFHVMPSAAIYLRISNLGTVMARDVRFTFDRPLTSTLQMKLMELQIFKQRIEALPPGQVIETFFDTFFNRDEKDDRTVATVIYRGDGGRRFRDRMDLDLGLYRNTSPVRGKTLDDVYKEVETIAETLRDFKAGGGGGLLVVTPKDVAHRHEQFRAAVEERQAVQAKPVRESENPSNTAASKHEVSTPEPGSS